MVKASCCVGWIGLTTWSPRVLAKKQRTPDRIGLFVEEQTLTSHWEVGIRWPKPPFEYHITFESASRHIKLAQVTLEFEVDPFLFLYLCVA